MAALEAQQDELLALVGTLDDEDLARGSRCGGWSVADVLLHLAQTNEMAVASVGGRLDDYIDSVAAVFPEGGSIDALAGALVDAERTSPAGARDRFVTSCAAQTAAFARCDPSARLRWVAGELAARSLTTTRLAETWIHTADVAVAVGPEPAPTDRLWHISRLAWRTVPYAFERAGTALAGPVAFQLSAPDGDTWAFGEHGGPLTVLRGSARDLCTVAGQRADARDTGLEASGPDAADVLRLVRTFA